MIGWDTINVVGTVKLVNKIIVCTNVSVLIDISSYVVTLHARGNKIY